jgi:ergothioneine biosynthesis protein EgtB
MQAPNAQLQQGHRELLADDYRAVRALTENLCAPLQIDDYQLQSIIETSPPKWHIAHVSWFFEAFVLTHFDPGYRPFHPRFAYLFNSYYETAGPMQPRPQRSLLSRPTVEDIYRYRAYVDNHMLALIDRIDDAHWPEFVFRATLGLNHEQQHQELLLMDIKHNFSVNPLKPAYRDDLPEADSLPFEMHWLERSGGIAHIGHEGDGFCFDNETPRHEVLLQPHRIADRTVTNAEYLAFIDDGGYHRSELWLADGWYLIRQQQWTHPLYWQRFDDEWHTFTLGGLRILDPDEPVCHVSFYEADAYARWAGKRLPTEAELETVLTEQPLRGNLLDSGLLQPRAGSGQWYGNVWEWTASAYAPYPGFRPLEGSMGEYNGKFMCNQMTLRGGCCVTPAGHIRASYRNFFYPRDRWPFTGIRLAEDV